MSSVGSVTHWINQLKAGDRAATRELWQRYFQRLMRLVRKKLQGIPRRAADEEDVALIALDSFFRAAERGRFRQLQDRNDLWQLLVVIAERKVSNLINHERRQKRGGGAVLGESGLPGAANPDAIQTAMDHIMGREPAPELAVEVAEEFQRLIDMLDDEVLRSVALLKVEGYTEDEIATKLNCVPRTVRRRLQLIRKLWTKEIKP